ncbi:MAG: restriction endonuclease [Planctomycetes bacterium]|nr:restriction endonuclease [Planctomycetota bacterium]
MKPAEFMRAIRESYKTFKRTQERPQPRPDDEDEPRPELMERPSAYDQAVEQGRTEIEQHINDLSWYDFQKLAAALLSGMGYEVRFIAPPGRDGGIDIVAYGDALGTTLRETSGAEGDGEGRARVGGTAAQGWRHWSRSVVRRIYL